MLKKSKIFLLAAVLVLSFAQVAFPALNAVGPVIPDADGNPLTPPWSAGFNGFPQWYMDSLGQLATLSNPPSPLSAPDPVDPLNPFSVQVGWGAEAFFWSSEATVVGSGVDALLVLALEAAWAAEEPNPGDQMVFARVRIRVDTPVAGDYTIIHPYGQKIFTDVPVGVRTINDTVDIGAAPGEFTGALAGQIGPFLRQVGAAAGTFGDGTLAPVVNGPNGNIFRVIGPGGIDVQTDQFSTTGEMFAGTPFTVTRTTYTKDAVNGAFAEAFVSVPSPVIPGTQISARVRPAPGIRLTRSGTGFFGRFPFDGVVPDVAVVTGRINGANNTVFRSNLVDVVSITKAQYSVSTQTLTVAATSSDTVGPLTLRGFGWVGATAAGQLLNAGGADTVFAGVPIAPVSVEVRSSMGGTATVPTTILP